MTMFRKLISVVVFQQDGALAHKQAPSRTLLRSILQDNIIGCEGVVEWPPRSSDLSSLVQEVRRYDV